jgi:hypothetical protein
MPFSREQTTIRLE